jgi:hypothetical protein
MKIVRLTLVFSILSYMACGQPTLDSLLQKRTVTDQAINTDSLVQSSQLPYSLSPSFQKLDSIRNEFTIEADSMQEKYQQAVRVIEEKNRTLINAIDSLEKLDLPAGNYTRKLDSLQRLKNNFESNYKSRFDSLKSKTIRRLQSLDFPPEYKEPLQKFTTNITELNINTDIPKIPSIDIPGYSIPDINGVGDLSSTRGQMGDINNAVKLPDVQTSVGDLDQISGQAGAYQEDIKKITQGNIQEVENIPKGIEAQASRIDGVDEIQKQGGVIDDHKTQLDKLAHPEDAKDKAITIAKEKAVDHFAGKQEQLKSAMDKISKYKQKYSSVSSIKDLPKRPPNPMKGKPFIERLTPGIYFQYQRKNYYLLDVNPYAGYKLSGRFAMGLGWNHRLAWDSKYERWNKRSRIFGPRAFVDFKLGKGFIAHVEGETMNSFVPSTLHGNPDAGHREWVWGCMTGLKKEYRIYKNLKGTALIQYNVFNRYYKAPYVDRLNSRIGFEYVLKKKSVKQ